MASNPGGAEARDDEALSAEDKVLSRYPRPDFLIIDEMRMKPLPKRSNEYLFAIIMRRHETRSTMRTSKRPLEDWGKLLGDVSTATAILDRFLHNRSKVAWSWNSCGLRRASRLTCAVPVRATAPRFLRPNWPAVQHQFLEAEC